MYSIPRAQQQVIQARDSSIGRSATDALADTPPVDATASRRAFRLAIIVAVVMAYVGAGIAFGLNPIAYLLLGVPLTIGFQVLVARRPIRSLWVVDAQSFRIDRVGLIIALALALVAGATLVRPGLASDGWIVAYGVVAMAGAFPAAFALRKMDGVARRALARSLMTVVPVGGGLFVLVAFVSRGLGAIADPVGMLAVGVVSFLQYLPMVFLVEEVLFRGALDVYARSPRPGGDWTSALVVSALWGAWHVPLTFAVSGLSQLPIYVAFHTVQGLLYTTPWRRAGNLAVPGITHATVDAIRNAFVGV